MNTLFKPKLYVVLKQGYTRQLFNKDLFAGIMVGLVTLPLAIAFAVASGVSPEKGLITAIVAGLIISLIGGSRFQIGGPTGVFIVVIYGIVQKYGLNGLMISTILAGFMLIGFGLLRLGVIIKFIPNPLVVGFMSGIALVIVTTQVKYALGLPIYQLPDDFIGKWISIFSNFQINFFDLIITIGTILIAVFSSKLIRKI